MKPVRRMFRSLVITVMLAVSTLVWASAPVTTASADSPGLTDYDQQALYIVKFGMSYVEWPEITYSNEIKVINVCVFGDNPAFLKSLEVMQGKAASRVKINIRSEAAESIAGCNIAYIPRNKQNYKEILASVGSHAILTVAPINGFASSGGMIEFINNETKDGSGAAPFNSKVVVNFKVNNKVASASSLKIAPEFLELSKEVIQ